MDTISGFSKFVYRCGTTFFSWIGFFGVYVLARVFGNFVWICLPYRRRLAIESIEKHLNVSRQKAKEIAKKSFVESFRSFLETGLAEGCTLDHEKIYIENVEIVERIKKVMQPIVIVTGHIGAWELSMGPMCTVFSERKKTVVVRNYKNAFVRDFSTLARSSKGCTVVGHRNAVRSSLRGLKNNGVVCFLVDHNTSQREALFLPFLGELAAVNKGPALIAVRAGALVVPFYLIRQGKRYALCFNEPLDTKFLQGTIEEKVHQTARYYTDAIEKIIQKYPEQWFWMHNRWKTRPKEG